MKTDFDRQIKRTLLYALIGSLVSAAVLGIILVVRNTWGWFEVRVVMTTIIVAVASLCGLACDLSRTRRGRNILPVAGLILTLIGALMLLAGLWFDVSSEQFWKFTATVAIFAVATVHYCLLSIARLARRFSWVLFVASQLIYGLAILITSTILFDVDPADLFRFMAALSIMIATITLVIPILHRISREEFRSEEALSPVDRKDLAAIDEELARLHQRIAELEQLRAKVVEAK